MQIYTGTVLYEAGEPYVGNYGPRINVVIENLSDPNAPKAQDGQLKIYKKPDSQDGRYMTTLRRGDQVQLVYTDNGSMAYYNFVVPTGASAPQQMQPAQNSRQTTASPPNRSSSARNQQIWLPMTDDQLVVYTHVVEQELELIAHIMDMVNKRFNGKLSSEDVWKIAASIYIEVNKGKKYRPEFVVLDDQPDPEPVGGYSQAEPAELAF